eukprot:2740870-Rhodomonas_salina.7
MCRADAPGHDQQAPAADRLVHTRGPLPLNSTPDIVYPVSCFLSLCKSRRDDRAWVGQDGLVEVDAGGNVDYMRFLVSASPNAMWCSVLTDGVPPLSGQIPTTG